MSAASRPWPLARWSASEAHARNVLAQRLPPIRISSWQGPGPQPQVSVSALASGTSLLGPDEVTRLAFEWSGARLWLDMPPSAVERWVHVCLGVSTWVDLDASMREAALEAAAAGVVASLSAAGRGNARFSGAQDSLPQPPAAAKHSCAVVVSFEDGSDPLTGVLHADTLGLLLLGGLYEQAGGTAAPEPDALQAERLAHATPLTWHVCLGTTDVAFSELQTVQRGDVIFIAQPHVDAQMRLLLRCDLPGHAALVAQAQLDHLTLTLLEAPRPMDNHATTASAEQAPSADDAPPSTPVSLQDIPVRLSFDVGHKTITLAELQQLQPGASLVLDRPASQYVTLRANGAAIGTGHLVEIDNRLGICIDSLQPPAPHAETGA